MLPRIIIYCIVSFGLIMLVTYSGKYITEYSTNPDTKMIIKWFTLLIVINIVITTFIFISYTGIKFKQGPPGPKGKRGSDGSQGKDGTCIMCSPALMELRKIPKKNRADRIDPMVPREEKKLFTKNKKQST